MSRMRKQNNAGVAISQREITEINNMLTNKTDLNYKGKSEYESILSEVVEYEKV